jgi:chemotaxis methyl-accepting protein methylase
MQPAERPRDSLPLAFGELEPAAAGELHALKEQITRDASFPCHSYKEKYLRRRIAVRMRVCGVHSYHDYARWLRGDAQEYAQLVEALTINVSKFFRNPEVWDAVAEQVLPPLLASTSGPLRIWSAGCAAGEEPYSVRMLLDEQGAVGDHDVLGTDIDAPILEQARRAEYSGFAMADTSERRRERWFEPGPPYRLRPEARRGVSFQRHDLLRNPLPQGQHLVLCRNVVIYFERPLQEELFQRLHGALAPGGYLVLGKVEALAGRAARLFTTVSARQRIFRRQEQPAPGA